MLTQTLRVIGSNCSIDLFFDVSKGIHDDDDNDNDSTEDTRNRAAHKELPVLLLLLRYWISLIADAVSSSQRRASEVVYQYDADGVASCDFCRDAETKGGTKIQIIQKYWYLSNRGLGLMKAIHPYRSQNQPSSLSLLSGTLRFTLQQQINKHL